VQVNRLFQQIEQQIAAGKLKPGETLPAVSELQREFNATEDEVKQAISELIYEGFLERARPEPLEEIRVPRHKLWGTLTGIHSITHEARKRNMAPGVKVLSFDIVPAWSPVQERLQLRPEDEIVIMERLRTADGEPVAIETSYMPAKYMPGISKEMFEQKDAAQSSFEVMQKKFGLKSSRAVDELTVAAIERREAELLEMEEGTPVLLRFRITYSDQDVPIKCSRALWKFKAGYQMALEE
jgi:GntR family transcriptional regulator